MATGCLTLKGTLYFTVAPAVLPSQRPNPAGPEADLHLPCLGAVYNCLHKPKCPDVDRRLVDSMRKLADRQPRYGCERIHELLPTLGWRVNFKRAHRLWKLHGMQVPRKQRKRRRLPGLSRNSCVRHKAMHRNHVWSYDFVVDRTEDGRQLKLLVVIDEFTRECLAAEVGRTFTSREVILTLQYLFAVRGSPEHIR